MPDPRLSLNQKTTARWSLEEAVEACAEAGISWIGLWREEVAAVGASRAAEIVDAAGLRVSSLCRGGFFTSDSSNGQRAAIEDNRRAIEEAAVVGANTVLLVCGGIAGGDLDGSRRQVENGIEAIVPHAEAHGVRLAIEPLHPMLCADRSVIVTLGQALTLASGFPVETVGVVIDTFHLWWDPDVWTQIERAGPRIFSYQVGDWLDPLPDLMVGRGMMGDGVIDFSRFSSAVDRAGYAGPIEVEIFNHEIWNRPGREVLAMMIDRYDRFVAPRQPHRPRRRGSAD